MRTTALAIAALATLALAATNAHAAQFTFDPDSGINVKKSDNLVPIAIIAIASLIGALLIALERKKAKGIWFSNSGRMR